MSRVDSATIEARSRASAQPRPGRALIGAGLVVLALFVLATRMVPHPVGAARTDSKYQGKAVTTATSARSSVNTSGLIARTYNEGNSFGPYANLVATDAEDDLSGVQGTFDSIQPPSEKSDQLREELDQLLSDAASDASEVRIVIRRGQMPSDELLASLDDDARMLGEFIEAHS